MRDRLAERLRHCGAKARPILSNGSVVLVLLMLVASGVGVSQTGMGFEYDFEEYSVGTNAPGPWSGGDISSDSFYGNRSLHVADEEEAVNTNITVNMTDVWVTGTVKPNFRTILILGSPNTASDRIIVRFDTPGEGDATLISANGTNSPTTPFLQDNEWYKFRISNNDTHTILTLWDASDPSSNVTVAANDITEQPAERIEIDTAGTGRQIWYDNLTVNNASDPGIGEEPIASDEQLEIDTRDYIMPNESAPYSVHFNDSGSWSEVTENATVTSNNTSVIVVNSAENLLEGQPGVNTTVNVTAEYQASGGTVYTTTKQITVAQATVENLEILPAIWRFGATFGDDTIFFLIIATLTSIVATRFSTAFGGLSLYWVVVMLGWFSGWVSVGILMLATVMCMFIGLNLAANINYGAVGSFRAGR